MVKFIFFTDTVRVYDYLSKTPMCQAKYNSGGSSLLWVPREVSLMIASVNTVRLISAVKTTKLVTLESYME